MAGILDFLGGDNLQQLVKGLSEKQVLVLIK